MTGQSSASQPAPNFAPLRDLERARKQQPYQKKKLIEVLKGFRAEMRKEGETQEWVNRILNSQRNEFFYRGYQKLRRADLSNSWRPEDPKPIHYTLNEYQFWINVNGAKWIASRTDFQVAGLDDTDDAEMQAAKLRDIARAYDARFWTKTETLKASKAAQFTAYLIAYVFYNPRAGVKAKRPITERMRLKLGPDSYRCADCNSIGEMPDGDLNQSTAPQEGLGIAPEDGMDPAAMAMPESEESFGAMPAPSPVCPNCGSSAVAITEVPTEEFDVPVGEEEYEAGDVQFRLISLYNMRWDAGLGLAKSPIVLWEEEYSQAELEAEYPGLNLPEEKSTTTGLQAKATLEHAGYDRGQLGKKSTLTRMWVEPSRYCGIEEEEEIKTVAGVTFPIGTKWDEVFPEGFHVIMAGDLVLDLFAANKNEDLCDMEYFSMPSGGLAHACGDFMCEPQRQLNTVYSFINVWIRHEAMPPKRYNPELIDSGDMSGNPILPIPINYANLGLRDGATIENAIYADPQRSMPAGVFEYANRLRDQIQFAANATEFSDGLPNVKNETLGGARIGQSLSQSISGTVLAGFADFRVEIQKRVLKKLHRHCWDTRYIQYSGKYGQIEGIELSGQEIPEDFVIEAVPNSWQPRTPEQRQQNLQAMLQAVGGVQGLLMVPPDALAELCEIYDVRLDANLLPAAIRTARMRIKQMQQALPMLQELNAQQNAAGMPIVEEVPIPGEPEMDEMGNPIPVEPVGSAFVPVPIGQQLIQALIPPFNPREKGTGEAADYLSTWFITDEGLNSPQDLIDAVGALQDLYIEAASIQQMVRSGIAMAGQPPPSEDEPPSGSSKKGEKKKAESKPTPGALAPVGG